MGSRSVRHSRGCSRRRFCPPAQPTDISSLSELPTAFPAAFSGPTTVRKGPPGRLDLRGRWGQRGKRCISPPLQRRRGRGVLRPEGGKYSACSAGGPRPPGPRLPHSNLHRCCILQIPATPTCVLTARYAHGPRVHTNCPLSPCCQRCALSSTCCCSLSSLILPSSLDGRPPRRPDSNSPSDNATNPNDGPAARRSGPGLRWREHSALFIRGCGG